MQESGGADVVSGNRHLGPSRVSEWPDSHLGGGVQEQKIAFSPLVQNGSGYQDSEQRVDRSLKFPAPAINPLIGFFVPVNLSIVSEG